VPQEFFQFVIGRIRMDESDQLHLVELMLADHALGVLAVGAGFGAEAGGEGAVGDGQLAFGQGRVPVDVGHRDLGRGDEVIVRAFEFEEVFLEFGSWPVPSRLSRLTMTGGMTSA
jgi:hypothetical protein